MACGWVRAAVLLWAAAGAYTTLLRSSVLTRCFYCNRLQRSVWVTRANDEAVALCGSGCACLNRLAILWKLSAYAVTSLDHVSEAVFQFYNCALRFLYDLCVGGVSASPRCVQAFFGASRDVLHERASFGFLARFSEHEFCETPEYADMRLWVPWQRLSHGSSDEFRMRGIRRFRDLYGRDVLPSSPVLLPCCSYGFCTCAVEADASRKTDTLGICPCERLVRLVAGVCKIRRSCDGLCGVTICNHAISLCEGRCPLMDVSILPIKHPVVNETGCFWVAHRVLLAHRAFFAGDVAFLRFDVDVVGANRGR